MASQPPGPSQGKQRHPPHHRCHLPHPCPHSHPLVIVVVVSPVPVPVPIPLSLSSLSPLSLSLSPSPSPHHRRCVTVVPVSLSFLCHCRSCVTVVPVSLSFLCHCRSCVTVVPVSLLFLCHRPPWCRRPVSSLSCCVGICQAHLVVIVFMVLAWTHCHVVVVVLAWTCCHCHCCHIAVAFAMGILSLSSSSCWREHIAVHVLLTSSLVVQVVVVAVSLTLVVGCPGSCGRGRGCTVDARSNKQSARRCHHLPDIMVWLWPLC